MPKVYPVVFHGGVQVWHDDGDLGDAVIQEREGGNCLITHRLHALECAYSLSRQGKGIARIAYYLLPESAIQYPAWNLQTNSKLVSSASRNLLWWTSTRPIMWAAASVKVLATPMMIAYIEITALELMAETPAGRLRQRGYACERTPPGAQQTGSNRGASP